ncbi:flagellin [Polymorphum gilvum]|uniref:Flagellin n=1 Tax=Polymorphum gilvum (strain LMG 25793 / CGMCC 1.9160 / SL003B-26A1) TaxID=991905 RepID=F2J5D2_POLGS|nr:flagellin [Polymorphum gilvum]ADZ72302.1 Flagellin-like protein [Polymorphum gilvum SL003B-26A1]
MSSLMTNASAMTALQTLSATNKALAETQSRISTGYRVATAEDNAAYWSIATTMRSDNMALSAVEDALGLGAATLDTMYTAMDSTVDLVNEIKAKLVAARQPGVDRGKIQEEITALQDNLRSIADSAVFNGENWLSVDSSDAAYNATKSVVGSFSRQGGAITIEKIDIDITRTELYDDADQSGILDKAQANGNTVATINIAALTDSAADLTTLEGMISDVDDALGEITDAATSLGAAKRRVELQREFISALTDALDRGIGQLVDADMNAESTRLQALQVQQQLGIQALSIANSSSQNILSLFR